MIFKFYMLVGFAEQVRSKSFPEFSVAGYHSESWFDAIRNKKKNILIILGLYI